MVILRALVFLQFFSCSALLLFKRLGSDSVNSNKAFDWLFIFSYPMAYIVLLFMVVLLSVDVFRFRATKKGKYLAWGLVDVLIPVVSYLIFEEYYSLIGHM